MMSVIADDFRLADIDGHPVSFISQNQEGKPLLLIALNKDVLKKTQLVKLKTFLGKLTASNDFKIFLISTSLPDDIQNHFDELKEFKMLYDASLAVSLQFQFQRAFDYRVLDAKNLTVTEEGNLTKLHSPKLLWRYTQGVLDLKSPAITYVKNKGHNFKSKILPALERTCLNCHAKIEGMHLFDDLDSIQAWRAMMLNNIRLGYMPASFSPNGQHELLNHYSNHDLRVVTSWLNDGAKAQKQDSLFYKNYYQLKKQSEKKHLDLLGKADLVIEAEEEVVIPAESGPINKSFQFDLNLEKEQFIDKVFLVSNPQAYHHMRLYVSPKPLVKKNNFLLNLDTQWIRARASFGTEKIPAFVADRSYQLLEASRVTGLIPEYPCYQDVCFRAQIPKTGYLTLDAHYFATGKIEKDKPKLLIFFKKKNLNNTKKMEKLAMVIGQDNFVIQPNTGPTPVIVKHVFDRDTLLLGYNLHAHLRGRSSKLMLKRKNSSVYETIFSNPHFQFKIAYSGFLKRPIKINKGDVIVSEVVYDNSISNELVPNPNIVVGAGENALEQEVYLVIVFHSSQEDK